MTIRPIDGGKPKEKKKKKVSFEHRQILNQLLKTIQDTPMDDELKSILRMRVWGKYPQTFEPMNHFEIANSLKTTEENVQKWEKEGIYYITQRLNQSLLEDIIGRFNSDRINRSKLFNDGGRIISPT